MDIGSLITALLIAAKLVGLTTMSWLMVFIPMIISASLGFLLCLIGFIFALIAVKRG